MNAVLEEAPANVVAEPEAKRVADAGWDQELERVAEICERAAAGDLEARIIHLHADPKFARVCRAINHMLDMADSFVRESAVAMRNCSNDRFHRPILLRGLKGAYRQSAVILNQAGQKMQESTTRLAATARLTETARLATETASSLTSVAAACEELNASNAEISRQAADSARQTETAVNQAGQANVTLKSFSEATRKIENMLALINKIAGQTNLLALNATIEAARAGEQGRGFAVVANEVKELARNSAKATEEIGQRIEAMRNQAEQVAKFIQSVNTSIQSINEAAAGIANSVNEQLQVTNEMSRNIAQASQATNEISSNMNGALNR
ncbi:MAG: methyl-accepting chemotaxis protein [Verrucomicrobiota bacterium]